jgi:hypothetical protein
LKSIQFVKYFFSGDASMKKALTRFETPIIPVPEFYQHHFGDYIYIYYHDLGLERMEMTYVCVYMFMLWFCR